MHYEQLMALVTLALFGATSTVAAAGVAFAWHHRRGAARMPRSGVSRARRLVLLRSLPCARRGDARAAALAGDAPIPPHGGTRRRTNHARRRPRPDVAARHRVSPRGADRRMAASSPDRAVRPRRGPWRRAAGDRE